MKKIMNILMALFLAFTYACSNDQVGAIYEPGNDEAEFSAAQQTFKLKSKEENVYLITATRMNTSGKAEVAITTATENAEIFSVPSQIVFEDGESEVSIPVTIDFDAMVLGESYDLVLNLPKQAIKEKVVSTVLTVSRDYTWNSVATGAFTSGLFESTTEAELLQATENPQIYKLVAPYQEGYDMEFMVNPDQTIALLSGLNDVDLYDFEPGVNHSSYGPISSYVFPSSTFDSANKVLTLDMYFYVSAGGFGQFVETFTWE